MGWDGRKSLRGVILRAPLCGANKQCQSNTVLQQLVPQDQVQGLVFNLPVRAVGGRQALPSGGAYQPEKIYHTRQNKYHNFPIA